MVTQAAALLWLTAMRLTTLIDTGTLAGRLSDPTMVVIDCRFDLKDTSAGERL
jgi:hypothetical protein